MTKLLTSLSIRKRLLFLTCIPLASFLAVAVFYLSRLYSEYQHAAKDVAVFEALSESIGPLNAFMLEKSKERELAFSYIASGFDAGKLSGYKAQMSETDLAADAFKAAVEEDLTLFPSELFETNATVVFETIDDLLVKTRESILAGESTLFSASGGYAKLAFRPLRIVESFRPEISTSSGQSFFDGLYVLAKLAEQESMVVPFFLSAQEGYLLSMKDLSVIRKQYASMTDNESDLRKFYPALYERWENSLKLGEGAAFWSFFARIFEDQEAGKALVLADVSGKGLAVTANARYAEFLELSSVVAFDLCEEELLGAAASSRQRAMVLSIVIFGTLLVTGIASLVVMRDTFSRLTSISEVISGSVHQVEEGAQQIAESNEDISHNVSGSAASMEEINATMEEIAASARTSKALTEDADRIANQAKGSVDKGRNAVLELGESMISISESSRRITEIIDTINDISNQTNILALNAAVEAARAGAAGAGFSVVADEVRNLAHKCAAAAAETGALVKETSDRANQAADKSKDVSETFDVISEQVEQVRTSVAVVSKDFGEQALGLNSVKENLGHQDKIAQSTAAGAEETAAAAGAMNHRVHELRGSVAKLNGLLGKRHLKRMGQSEDEGFAVPVRGVAAREAVWN